MAKQTDINGYWIYENVPITRTGVFPYRGRQIDSDGKMGLDPNRKYPVYRPASEITNPQTLASFDGVFLVDEHRMMGEGQTDASQRRIDGSVYNVHVDPHNPGVVLATLKVQTRRMKDLIDSGKRALSCGYYCDYRPQKGVFNGMPYDFVQFDLTGNHLALVKKGRCGEKCAIMDGADTSDLAAALHAIAEDCADSADMTDALEAASAVSPHGRMESRVRKGKKMACDSAYEIPTKGTFMPTENYDEMLAKALEGKGVKDKANIEKIVEFIATLQNPAATDPAKDADDAPVAPAADPAAAPVAPVADPVAPAADPAKDADDAPVAPAADPAAAAPTPVTKEEFQAAVDAAVAERYAKEDEGRQLAEDIAPKCGNVWKRGMDADDVAEAACEKMGHKDLPKEARIPFVKAMAAEARKPGGKDACDSAFDAQHGKSATLTKYLGK